MNAGTRRFGPVIVASVLIAAAQVARGAGAPAAQSDAAIAPCQACHGAHGEGMAAAHVPRIAGQTADYVKKQFLAINEDTAQRTVTAHITCATDQENVKIVFNAIRLAIIKASMLKLRL